MQTELLLPSGTVLSDIGPGGRVRSHALLGTAIIGVFMVGFGGWASFAPLSTGAVAPGVVEVESMRKTIQHLEGGIIGAILVHDGDKVAAGQPLIHLDATKAASSLTQLQGDIWDQTARAARLRAEQNGAEQITWPATLTDHQSEAEITAALAGQQQIFETHRQLEASKIAAINQKNDQAREEINGLKAQDTSFRRQRFLIDEERKGVQELMDKGLERRPRLLALQRTMAEIDGKAGEIAGQLARANQTLAETQVQILNLRNDRQSQASEQLRETEQKLTDLLAQMMTARDMLARTDILAPVDGTVTDLKVHTPGGVIQPGEALLDVVPTEDRLIITAEVRPDDIDGVRTGLAAHIRFPAYKQRATPSLMGTVLTVSADRIIDKRTNQPYYAARIAVDPSELAGHPDVKLVAGMQADAVIETGKTTVALYALAPIFDTFHKAFRDR
jgi:HlyD family secretion protein